MEQETGKIQKFILAAVCQGDEEETSRSLDELEELLRTAGGVSICRVMQTRTAPHPGTYLGSGKIEEIREYAQAAEADGIVCDDELSPAQMKNLTSMLDIAVLDRTMLILDIFASRAATSEGKIQVELAQLNYRMTHLTGMGKALSRLGGGIGTRGPGEKKLEIDRRRIRSRITRLNDRLDEVKRHRDLLRSGRREQSRKSAAIVGYTNAGKSTLLNRLTDAGILAEDKLFATLDPTTRVLKLEGGLEILLTDTVGFIRKLPHHLIDAFRSTLEEACYADLILHVADASNPQIEQQMEVVRETLMELGVKGKPVITIFNKSDRNPDAFRMRDRSASAYCAVSAKTGDGMDRLMQLLEDQLTENLIRIERSYSYDQAGRVGLIRTYGHLLELEYTDDGIHLKALIPPSIYGNV